MARRQKRSAVVDTRIIYRGDCLDKLVDMPDDCIDLIYIDPPFNSNRDYEVVWGATQDKRSFNDKHASTQAYIDFMRPRCEQLQRVLKKTGSMYYHCDWHASHYIKVMLDGIFGESNFQSEIIWKRTTAKSLSSRGYANNHDTIFYYTGGKDFVWNRPYQPYDEDNLDAKTAAKYSHRDPDGRRYTLGDLTNPNPNRPNLTYEFLGHHKVWRWTRSRMREAYKNGIVVQPRPGAVPRLKRYLDEQKGRPIDTVWTDIAPLNSQAKERVGYPTQKPLSLLKRIIHASSNENDIVLDAFCGCGTAMAEAQNSNRQWIGMDISPTACDVTRKRIHDDCDLPEDKTLWKAGRGFVVRDILQEENALKLA